MNYLLHIGILVMIYSILSIALNLLAGYTGRLSICQAAFFGIGAYTTGILSLDCGWSWLPTVGLGLLISTGIAIVVGWTSLRFRHDYFVMATFAFQVILYSLMLNWIELTKGPMGLPGIPSPVILGWHVDTNWEFLLLSAVIMAATVLIIRQLVEAPYGKVLRSIREDEVYVQALGKNVAAFKISAFVIGAMFASVAGSLYASYITYIDPSNFTVHESIFILAIVIIGGAGNIWGSVAGAVALVTIPELLRFTGLPPLVAANVRQVLYGALLVACMIWRPQGLIGELTFNTESEA